MVLSLHGAAPQCRWLLLVLLLLPSASAKPAASGREYVIYMCNDGFTDHYFENLKNHSHLISSVIFYTYAFNASTPAGIQHFAKFNTSKGGWSDSYKFTKKYQDLGIDVWATCGGNHENLGALLQNPTQVDAFIAWVLKETKEQGYKGWHIDIESGSFRGEYLAFLLRLDAALKAQDPSSGGVAPDSEGCPNGAAGATCGEYRNSSIGSVLLMQWYAMKPRGCHDAVDRAVNDGAKSLRADQFMPAWHTRHSAWLSNASCVSYMLQSGVTCAPSTISAYFVCARFFLTKAGLTYCDR